MAKRNKVDLDERKVDDMVATVVAEKNATKEEKKASIVDLFRNRQLCLRTLNICFCWMVNSGTYYGLALSASNLGGNPYYNYLIRFSYCPHTVFISHSFQLIHQCSCGDPCICL